MTRLFGPLFRIIGCRTASSRTCVSAADLVSSDRPTPMRQRMERRDVRFWSPLLQILPRRGESFRECLNRLSKSNSRVAQFRFRSVGLSTKPLPIETRDPRRGAIGKPFDFVKIRESRPDALTGRARGSGAPALPLRPAPCRCCCGHCEPSAITCYAARETRRDGTAFATDCRKQEKRNAA